MLTDYQNLAIKKVRENAKEKIEERRVYLERIINQYEASRDSDLNPEKWSDIGSKSEVFQYMKQLWHTIGYFG